MNDLDVLVAAHNIVVEYEYKQHMDHMFRLFENSEEQKMTLTDDPMEIFSGDEPIMVGELAEALGITYHDAEDMIIELAKSGKIKTKCDPSGRLVLGWVLK